MNDANALVVVLLPFMGKEIPIDPQTKTLLPERWMDIAGQLSGLVGYKVEHDATGINLRSARLDIHDGRFRIVTTKQVQKLNVIAVIGSNE